MFLYIKSGQALVCLLVDNHGNRYYPLIPWEVGDSINTPTARGHGGWNLHKARPDILVDDQHICQRVHGGLFASQCIVTYTTQRAEINKPITWSVTATDIRVSLSWPVLATDNTSISQECAASSAKASNALLAINFSLNQQKKLNREKKDVGHKRVTQRTTVCKNGKFCIHRSKRSSQNS